MTMKAEYGNSACSSLQEVNEPTPGEVHQSLSGSELKKRAVDVPWLKASELSFEFWDNEEDAGYDCV